MRGVILSKENGNLLEEGLLITKELLDECLERGVFIDLKSGDYTAEKFGFKANGGKKFIRELTYPIYELYISGNFYPRDYISIFGMKSPERLVYHLAIHGKMPSHREVLDLYGDKINKTREQTNVGKFGVPHYTQTDEYLVQSRATSICNWGVPNASQAPAVKQMKRETNLKNRDAPHNWCSGHRDARDATMIKRHGNANAMFTEAGRRAWDEWYDSLDVVSTMALPEVKESAIISRDGSRYEELDFLLRNRSLYGNEEFAKLFIDLIRNYSKIYQYVLIKENNVDIPARFMTELKLHMLMESLDVKFYKNARRRHGVKTPNGRYYELDAYIPELKLGIEINGLAYHSVNKSACHEPKSKDYHFEKFKAFRDRGILMLSFTDFEQDHFKEDYENIIKHHLLGEPLNISKEFLEFNQISSIEESLNYGLFDPNQFTGNFEDHQHQRFINEFEYWDCGKLN